MKLQQGYVFTPVCDSVMEGLPKACWDTPSGIKGRHPPRTKSRHHPQADDYCCGWYASYWNTFLCLKSIH